METILLALALFLVLQASAQNFRVEGVSMRSTLTPGEYLLVNKLAYLGIPLGEAKDLLSFLPFDSDLTLYAFHPPERGRIVVFRFPPDPSRFFVKRIIGMPGDNMELRDGRVYLDGELQEESYVDSYDSSNMASLRVPDGKYFVMGDNRRFSNDSRDWDFVFISRSDIVGRSWLSYELPSQLHLFNPSGRIS